MPKKFSGNLTLGDAEDEAPVQHSAIDLTVFKDHVQRSWDKTQAGEANPAIGMTVKREQASVIESRFRDAARELGLGLTLQVIEPGTTRAAQYNLAADQVRLIIQAKEKRVNKPKAADNGAAAPAASGSTLPKPGQKAKAK